MFIIAYTHTLSLSLSLSLSHIHTQGIWKFAPTISPCSQLLDEYWCEITHDYILTGAKFCTENVTTVEYVVATWYRYLQFTMLVLEEHQDKNIIL
jgi:hypothetical protein